MTRGRYEGVLNIVRFNWPMFATTATVIIAALIGAALLRELMLRTLLALGGLALATGTLVALGVSHLIYDRSDLYRFEWLRRALGEGDIGSAVFCQTGFDECSAILRRQTPGTTWTLLDHYDPAIMTETSIQRARRRCPPAPGTITAHFGAWPLPDDSADLVVGMLAVHELRRNDERVAWFTEARRATRAGGRVVLVEHVRDTANLTVFGVGALHFHSVAVWTQDWERAKLRLANTLRITPWVRVFVLERT